MFAGLKLAFSAAAAAAAAMAAMAPLFHRVHPYLISPPSLISHIFPGAAIHAADLITAPVTRGNGMKRLLSLRISDSGGGGGGEV